MVSWENLYLYLESFPGKTRDYHSTSLTHKFRSISDHGANKYLEHSAKNIPGLTQRYSYNFGVFILVNSYI